MESKITYYKTPIGTAKIIGNADGIQSISILEEDKNSSKNIPKELENYVHQLEEYFQGNRK